MPLPSAQALFGFSWVYFNFNKIPFTPFSNTCSLSMNNATCVQLECVDAAVSGYYSLVLTGWLVYVAAII